MHGFFVSGALAILIACRSCVATLVTSQRGDNVTKRRLLQRPPVNALVGSHVAYTSGVVSRSGRGLRSAQPEQLEAWHDSQKAAKTTMDATEIASLSAGITEESFKAVLHAIVDKQKSRFVSDNGNKVAAQNIEERLRALGLKTEMQALNTHLGLSQYTSSTGGNVIGLLKGTDLSHEVVMVACHYDSVNWQNTGGVAPGVDDNGSGVALMLELAKAFAHSVTRPRRSILFVAFNAEEEGLHGSAQFATLFDHGGDGVARFGKPIAAIVADEVAWPGVAGSKREVILETRGQGEGTTMVVDTLAHAAQEKDGVNGFVVNYHGFGSDHISLLNAGVPAVLLIERDNMYHADTWGHTAKDTFEHVDCAFGAAVTRLALRAVAALAVPASPTVHSL